MSYEQENALREVYRDFEDHGAKFQSIEVGTLYERDFYTITHVVLGQCEEPRDVGWPVSRIIEYLTGRFAGIGIEPGKRLVALEVTTRRRLDEILEKTVDEKPTLRIHGPTRNDDWINETFVWRVSEKSPKVGKRYSGFTLKTGSDILIGPGTTIDFAFGEWKANDKSIEVLPRRVREFLDEQKAI